MKASLIDLILKEFHEMQWGSLDSVIDKLNYTPGLSELSKEDIREVVIYIQELTDKSRLIAQDMIFDKISHKDATDKIGKLWLTKNKQSIDIILERGRYYASR